MENELIKIEVHNGQQAVNARELHQVLGSKQEFANWIKNRIEKYGFVENQDFESFDNIVKRENGATVRKEYALSIDMAKELCMVENNENGRKIRQYFIMMEKKAKGNMSALPQTFAEALYLAAKQQEEIEKQQKMIGQQSEQIHQLTNAVTELQEKTSYLDKILASKSTVLVTSIAQDYGMSAKKFNQTLHDLGIQHKVNHQWILYSKYLSLGYVHSKAVEIDTKHGKEIKYNTEWTQKGRLFLYENLKGNGILPLIER